MLTLTILCLFFSLVRGLPMMLSRDVVDPPITSPTASTVWHSGDTVTVTWDTSNVNASQLTNPNGQIVLGWMASPTDSEHLMLDTPLAKDFPLTAGNASFTVPSVVTRTNYIVVLFGDSGNISPTFTIIGTDSSSSAQPTTSTITISPSSLTVVSTSTATVASPSGSSASSETSVTDIHTSVITESPSTTASVISTSPGASGASSISNSLASSSATGSSSSASTSASAEAASSNAASKVGTHQSQVMALVAAGLLAVYLL